MNSNNYYRLKAKEFLNKLKQAQEMIDHNLSRGYVGEELLREYLSKALPNQIKVTQGFIFNDDKISHQCDIIIYDCIHYVPIFSYGNIDIIPSEAVFLVIEVKTAINRISFNKVITDFKMLNSMGVNNKLLFLYSSVKPKTIESYFYPKSPNIEISFADDNKSLFDVDIYHELPDLIIVLGSDFILEKSQYQDNRDYYGYSVFSIIDKSNKSISCLQKLLCYITEIITSTNTTLEHQLLNSQIGLELKYSFPITPM